MKTFTEHFSSDHQNHKLYYKCSETSCCRTFSNVNSLSEHILKKHDGLVDFKVKDYQLPKYDISSSSEILSNFACCNGDFSFEPRSNQTIDVIENVGGSLKKSPNSLEKDVNIKSSEFSNNYYESIYNIRKNLSDELNTALGEIYGNPSFSKKIANFLISKVQSLIKTIILILLLIIIY